MPRPRSLLALVLGSSLLSACAPDTPDARRSAAVDSLMTTLTAPGAPGCAIGVYRDGATLLAKGYGVANIETGAPITDSTSFTLGSVAKQFTALATLMLERDGKLSLDDEVARFLPELRAAIGAMRIRDLLFHTSGIRDYGTLEELAGRGVGTMPEFLQLVAAQRALNFTPGAAHEYSHSDYVLLAAVVERASGEPFSAYVERAILAPLGMRDSRIFDGTTVVTGRAIGHQRVGGEYRARYPTDMMTGGHNVHTSVRDWARWDRNFADGSVGGRALVDRMTTLPTLANGDTIPYAYGLRLRRYRGTPVVLRGSNSLGTLTEVFRFPEHRLGIAVLCNGDGFKPYDIGRRIADLYLADVLAPAEASETVPPPAVAIAPAALETLTGLYLPDDEPWNVLRIAVRDGKLVEELIDTVQTFTHVGDNEFTGDGSEPGFRLGFRRAGSGSMRLAVRSGSDTLITAERAAADRLWRPSRAQLAGYAGAYYSVDVDAGWQVALRDTALVFVRRGKRELPLIPIERDVFAAQMGTWADLVPARVAFERGSNGRITRLTVTTPAGEGSVRGLRFDRVDAP